MDSIPFFTMWGLPCGGGNLATWAQTGIILPGFYPVSTWDPYPSAGWLGCMLQTFPLTFNTTSCNGLRLQGATRSNQEPPTATRSHRSHQGPTRHHQEAAMSKDPPVDTSNPPGAARQQPKLPLAPRDHQESAGPNKEPPGAARRPKMIIFHLFLNAFRKNRIIPLTVKGCDAPWKTHEITPCEHLPFFTANKGWLLFSTRDGSETRAPNNDRSRLYFRVKT